MSNPLTMKQAAQAGGALLQFWSGIERGRAMKKIARSNARLEQMMIEREARADAEQRTRALNAILGTQRAVLAAQGVAGGATARAIEVQTRDAAQRDQDAADYTTLRRRQASRMGVVQAEGASRLARAQAGVDLLAAGVGLFGNRAAVRDADSVLGRGASTFDLFRGFFGG